MNVQTDLDINRSVRRVLVKHWVDLGRLSVRTTHGRVLIRGILQRIEGTRTELTTPIVEAIFAEAHRLPGVHRMDAFFDNWTRDGGRWRPAETLRPNLEAGGAVEPPTPPPDAAAPPPAAGP